MRATRGIAQAGARRRLPGAVDGEPVDFHVQPVQSQRHAEFEVGVRHLGHRRALAARQRHDVERGLEHRQARDAAREFFRDLRGQQFGE